jgi:hypothetical protein
LQPFSPEPFVFTSAASKNKNQNIKEYNFACVSVWLRNTVRMLGRIFGQKTDEVRGGWRKVHNEELHNMYSSPRLI